MTKEISDLGTIPTSTDADLYAALCKLLGLSEFGPVGDGSEGLGRAMIRLGGHLAQADQYLVRAPSVGHKVEWVEKGASATSPVLTGYVIGPVVSSAGEVKENCWVVNRSPEGMKLGDSSIVFVPRDRLRSAGATAAAARTVAEANR